MGAQSGGMYISSLEFWCFHGKAMFGFYIGFSDAFSK